jgi:hypothetical protein
MINYKEDHRDSASDGHFGPPVTETVVSDWKISSGFEKNKYPFRRLVSKLPEQKQR